MNEFCEGTYTGLFPRLPGLVVQKGV